MVLHNWKAVKIGSNRNKWKWRNEGKMIVWVLLYYFFCQREYFCYLHYPKVPLDSLKIALIRNYNYWAVGYFILLQQDWLSHSCQAIVTIPSFNGSSLLNFTLSLDSLPVLPSRVILGNMVYLLSISLSPDFLKFSWSSLLCSQLHCKVEFSLQSNLLDLYPMVQLLRQVTTTNTTKITITIKTTNTTANNTTNTTAIQARTEKRAAQS